MTGEPRTVELELPTVRLDADIGRPAGARGVVVFAHGSGSSRRSPRNRQVATALRDRALATVLFDLLTEAESRDRRNVFDIDVLAERLAVVVDLVAEREGLTTLPVGLFGASTGAAAALDAAVARPEAVAAVVSRGGRVDLASDLPAVAAPVRLIVGGADRQVLALNREAGQQLTCPWDLQVVPGAGHLFEGPGELEAVAELAGDWFLRHLASDGRGAGD